MTSIWHQATFILLFSTLAGAPPGAYGAQASLRLGVLVIRDIIAFTISGITDINAILNSSIETLPSGQPLLSRHLYTGTSGPGRAGRASARRWRRRSFAQVEGADEQGGRVGDEFNAARLKQVPVSWCSWWRCSNLRRRQQAGGLRVSAQKRASTLPHEVQRFGAVRPVPRHGLDVLHEGEDSEARDGKRKRRDASSCPAAASMVIFPCSRCSLATMGLAPSFSSPCAMPGRARAAKGPRHEALMMMMPFICSCRNDERCPCPPCPPTVAQSTSTFFAALVAIASACRRPSVNVRWR